MKSYIILLTLVLSVFLGCERERKAEVRFCADIRPDNPCIGEDSIFRHGNVWAQLLLEPGFKGTDITARLYSLDTTSGEKVLIEDKELELDKDQIIVMEMMFLNTCGNYMVEYMDDQGNLLAQKNLEIY